MAWPDWLEIGCLDINVLLTQHKDHLLRLRNQVELVVGGPPCQGFSMAGKREGNDARNSLYNAYVDFVKLVQPRMLFFENVHGFTVGFQREQEAQGKRGEPYSEKLINELKKLGYDVDSREIMMSEYGVPQKRKRFILFAIINGKAADFFDKLEENRAGFLERKGLGQAISIDEAIGDLNRSCGEVRSEDAPRFQNGVYGLASSAYQKLMRSDTADNAIPDSHRFAQSKPKTVEMFQELMNVSDEILRITPKMGLVEGLKKAGWNCVKGYVNEKISLEFQYKCETGKIDRAGIDHK